jgi:hypothetical protein
MLMSNSIKARFVLRRPHRHLMVNLYTSYSIVQAVVIVMLIGRLVGAWAFQARVGIICSTLWRAAEPLLQLGVIVLVISFLLAAVNHIMLGWRQEKVADIGRAVQVRWGAIVDSWCEVLLLNADPKCHADPE